MKIIITTALLLSVIFSGYGQAAAAAAAASAANLMMQQNLIRQQQMQQEEQRRRFMEQQRQQAEANRRAEETREIQEHQHVKPKAISKPDTTKLLLKKITRLSYRIDSLYTELESYKQEAFKELSKYYGKLVDADYLLSGYISEQRARIDSLLKRVETLEKRSPIIIGGQSNYPYDIDPGFSPTPSWPDIIIRDTLSPKNPKP